MSLLWKNIGLWWRYGISRHCDEWKYIVIGRIFESEIILIPPSLKISESSSNGSYRNTDEIWWRYGISRSCDEWRATVPQIVSPLKNDRPLKKKSSLIYLGPKNKSSPIYLGPTNLLCNGINWISRNEEQRKIIKNNEEKNPKLQFVHVHVYV